MKYAGAGVVVVAGAAAGAYYATRPSGPTTTETTMPTTEAKKTYKLAMIVECPRDDMGWGQINKEAVEYTQQYFAAQGIQVETNMAHLIPPPEFEKQGRVYAEEGYDLIFYPCDGHGPEVGRLAEEYIDKPDVHIYAASTLLEGDLFPMGTPPEEMVIPKNLAVCDYYAFVCSYYLMGIIAGSMTKTNKIGFLGGVEYPSIHRRVRAMQQGVLRWDPKIDVSQYQWVGSWIDVAKGKEMATAMHEYGCDVIMGYADGPFVGAATYAKAVGPPPYMFAAMWPLHKTFPEVIVAENVEYTAPVMIGCMDRIVNNKWDEIGGKWLKLGYSRIDPAVAWTVGDYGTSDVMPMGPVINPALQDKIPPDAMALMEQVRDEIARGSFKVPEITK